jgi:hydroxymethylbilane synthase
MSDLRIATRRSRLALAQADEVARLLRRAHPGLEVSLVEVTTAGDRDRTTSVTTLTEVGAFVRAVQETVLEGQADLAVHSCKDLPVDGPSGLVAFYPGRETPWDVLCGHDLESLPPGARVGTGSPRRAAQLKALRPDVEVSDIRGNVDTRLEKMHTGDYEAVVLAEAGLRRLGRENEIGHRFSLGEMVPAPGQAALAVEARADGPAVGPLEAIEDGDTRKAVEAERTLLARTRAGCRSALGALGVVEDSVIRLTGFVEDEYGPRSGRAEGTRADEAASRLQTVLGL